MNGDPIPFHNQREVLLRAENENLKETCRALHAELQRAQGFLLMSSQNTFRLNALLLYAAGGSATLQVKDFETFDFDGHSITQEINQEDHSLTLSVHAKTDEERAAEQKSKEEAERAAARSQILMPGRPSKREN